MIFRPGGGSSYTAPSSGGGGGGGGGGDGGAIIELLLWLLIEHPAVGIPAILLAIAYFVVKALFFDKKKDWSSGHVSGPPLMQTEPPAWRGPARQVDAIGAVDPGFSRIVFEDFLYSLYAEVQTARGAGQLNRVSAYLSENAARALGSMARGAVDTVIVGKLALMEATANAAGARVVADIESNYTEDRRGFYVHERWTLTRGPGARSRDPKRARILGCPSCGAPQDALFGGTCRHCGKMVNDGSFDWTVAAVVVLDRAERPPLLTSTVEEQGTDLPTVLDPTLPGAMMALRQKDPHFDLEPFKQRVGLVFQQFQRAWSGRDLASMRPFLSDALFTTQQYWIRAYLAQHLRNVTEDNRITNLQLAKVVSDPYYDAITIRVFATGHDYTVDDAGKVVSGSKSRVRAYSEYWTLIRGTNRKGPTRTDLACPNCGAPLDVNMAGDCKYCKVKITTGDFDWVLSKIEQDESYVG